MQRHWRHGRRPSGSMHPVAGAVCDARTWPVLALVLLFFLGVGATLPALPGAVRASAAAGPGLGVVLGVFPLPRSPDGW